ncbi:MAG: hypothetical protein Q4B26_02300 [Eubacteriales bacterium]|nr:hypothetical protein [Eubacteriales bacterium]
MQITEKIKEKIEKRLSLLLWGTSLLRVLIHIFTVPDNPYYRMGNGETLWFVFLVCSAVFMVTEFESRTGLKKTEVLVFVKKNAGKVLECAMPLLVQAFIIAFLRCGINLLLFIPCFTEELLFLLSFFSAGVIAAQLQERLWVRYILVALIGLLPNLLRFGSDTYIWMILEYASFIALLICSSIVIGRSRKAYSTNKSQILFEAIKIAGIPLFVCIMLLSFAPKGKTFREVTGYVGSLQELTTNLYGDDNTELESLLKSRFRRPFIQMGSGLPEEKFLILTRNGATVSGITPVIGSDVIYISNEKTGLTDVYAVSKSGKDES